MLIVVEGPTQKKRRSTLFIDPPLRQDLKQPPSNYVRKVCEPQSRHSVIRLIFKGFLYQDLLDHSWHGAPGAC